MDKKSKLIQSLEDYLNNTPPEQLKKDWEELEKYNQYGPNIEDCLDLGEAHCKQMMETMHGDVDAKSKDLCEKCDHHWLDFPLPLDRYVSHCEVLDEKIGYNPFKSAKEMDDVVPYPCIECPFNSFLPKKDEK